MFRPEGCPKLPYALGYTERGERLGYLSTHSHQGDNLYFVEFTDRTNQYVTKVDDMITLYMKVIINPHHRTKPKLYLYSLSRVLC